MKIVTLSFLLFLISCTDKTDINTEAKGLNTIQNPQPGEIISDSINVLERKIQKLELEYILWGGACAN